jgi:hypothetical protein
MDKTHDFTYVVKCNTYIRGKNAYFAKKIEGKTKFERKTSEMIKVLQQNAERWNAE